MITRTIEKKDYLRICIDYAELVEIRESVIVLKTFSTVKTPKIISSAELTVFDSTDSELMEGIHADSSVEGILQIDICADDVIHVRYSATETVPDNYTGIVVGSFLESSKCHIEYLNSDKDDGQDKIIIVSDKLQAVVHLKPYSLEIMDIKKQKKIAVGGSEKDYFKNWDSANTGICYDLSNDKHIAVENFSLSQDECIYGFGEKFIRLNKVGQTIDLNAEDALGVTTPRSYKNVPFFVSTKGYGVFFNHSSCMTFWVGSMSACDIQVAIEDNILDYYIFTGSIKDILDNYTTLTGKGVLPPKWSFGYWQSKISYSSAEETIEIVENMRKNKIPCDVICLDTNWYKKDWLCDLEFDKERFPDVEGYFKKMKDMGIKISLWQLPYIPEGSELFESILSVGGFVKDKNGDMYDIKMCFTDGFKGVVGIVDYTNPEAIKVHQEAFKKLFRMGAKAIKTDFGEAAPADGVYYDGTPGYKMRNLYPLLYNKAVFEVTKEETGDGLVWARSAWAGNQRYPLHWGGDSSPNFMNMIPQLEGGLSFGLSGFQFWSQDIGGFLGDTNDRLLIRWMQFGLFLSHSRVHGMGEREIFNFSEETLRICRDFIQLRYRLIPYLYGSAIECVKKSLPMARALVIEYQDDPNVWNISDQYLLGNSLMIAPIYDESNKRRVYFPEGVWHCWWSGEKYKGSSWGDVEADIEKIPLYIREGAIIPMGPVMNYVDEIKTDKIDLIISLFEKENSSYFTMVIDDISIAIDYTFDNNRHIIKIENSNIDINLRLFGEGTVLVEYTNS